MSVSQGWYKGPGVVRLTNRLAIVAAAAVCYRYLERPGINGNNGNVQNLTVSWKRPNNNNNRLTTRHTTGCAANKVEQRTACTTTTESTKKGAQQNQYNVTIQGNVNVLQRLGLLVGLVKVLRRLGTNRNPKPTQAKEKRQGVVTQREPVMGGNNGNREGLPYAVRLEEGKEGVVPTKSNGVSCPLAAEEVAG